MAAAAVITSIEDLCLNSCFQTLKYTQQTSMLNIKQNILIRFQKIQGRYQNMKIAQKDHN